MLQKVKRVSAKCGAQLKTVAKCMLSRTEKIVTDLETSNLEVLLGGVGDSLLDL